MAPSVNAVRPSLSRRSSWSPGRTAWWVTCLLVVAVPALAVLVRGYVGADVAVYRRGGEDVGRLDDLYRAGWQGLPFTYPPFAALAFWPLHLVSPVVMSALWSALVGGLLARTTWLLAGPLLAAPPTAEDAVGRDAKAKGAAGGWRRSAYLRATLLLAATVVSEPVLRTWLLGQVNVLVVWLLVEDWLGRGRLRGWLTALAVGVKLTPAVVGLALVLEGRWKTLGATVVGTLGTVAVAWLVRPHSSVTYWCGALLDPGRVGGIEYVGNQSLQGVIWRLAGPGGAPAVWGTSALLTVGLAALAARRAVGAGDRLGALLGCLVAGWLVSPISWSHHWVLLVPFLVWCWRGRDLAVRLVVVALLPWAYGWLPWLTPSEHHAEFHHTPWQQLLVNAQPLLTLLLLALVAVRPRWSRASDDLVVQPAATCHSRPATQGALSSAR
ncbi:glycosyltransferase 87 family protein [Arsenicicoccus dermatophilus]|uniref:glycosyltransferase 87 family protein n=1 Tax=Arsenicicoccus dermatophilus TaxID=1076331 RepID=UPI003917506F